MGRRRDARSGHGDRIGGRQAARATGGRGVNPCCMWHMFLLCHRAVKPQKIAAWL